MKEILFRINKKIINFLMVSLAFVFLSGTPVYAAIVMDFSDPSIAENIGALLEGPMDSDIIHPLGGVSGYITGNVYYNEISSVYTYVLAVTHQLDDPTVFKMGNMIGSPDKNPEYAQYYGYDYSEAKSALSGYYFNSPVTGDGSDIFSISIGVDNTLEWNLTNRYQDYSMGDYFYWTPGSTITFYYQHRAAPEIGFYNLDLSTANNFIPLPEAVPLPGTIILLGSSIFGLIGLKKIKKGARLT